MNDLPLVILSCNFPRTSAHTVPLKLYQIVTCVFFFATCSTSFKVFFILTPLPHVHLYSSCSQNVEMLFQLHPYSLQHSNINCLHNRNYPSKKCGKIWNKVSQTRSLTYPQNEKSKWSIQTIPNISRPMTIMFQQEGAPVHWSAVVKDLLNRHFLRRWIARDGPIAWPPRSSDITPLYFRGTSRTISMKPVPKLPTLRRRIVAVVQTVDIVVLHRV